MRHDMFRFWTASILLVLAIGPATSADICQREITVKVVALDQPFMWNREGSAQPMGMIYALERDVVPRDTPFDANGHDVLPATGPLEAGKVRLRSAKRARPFVVRANAGDCLDVYFTNLLSPTLPNELSLATRNAGFHVTGLELVPVAGQPGIDSDGNWVGTNPGDIGSLAKPGESRRYKLHAAVEGTYTLVNTPGDPGSLPRAEGGELGAGLFGAVIVQPKGAEWYRSQVTRQDLDAATLDADQLPAHMILDVEPGQDTARLYIRDAQRLERRIVDVEVTADRRLITAAGGHPLIDYQAVYRDGPFAGLPILSMLQHHEDGTLELIYSDLTALITGPGAGRFPDSDHSPTFRPNPALPDRRQPYREFVIIYHESLAVQPFQQFYDPAYFKMLLAGQDSFAINYGMAGLGVELLAIRQGLGPGGSAESVDLKFEEFFLSSWAAGDPAMVVDVPANVPNQVVTNPSESMDVPPEQKNQLFPTVTVPIDSHRKATTAYYADDPSNVYHSYLRDHVKFRIFHNGQGIPHVHHQHAEQWLHSPNSDNSHYLDSQLINPGASYTLEMVYNGSGNRNLTVGDSIFHCHFYPHFATGMWSLWRIHDVFEAGTLLDAAGHPLQGLDADGQPIWNRALPDAEIETGTPIPAVVPLPTRAMAPMPADVRLIDRGRRVEVRPEGHDEQGDPIYKNPGYPFFIPGMAGHRAPHPPLDMAWEEEPSGLPKLSENGNKIYLDGGLPRHLIIGGEVVREFHTRWDFSKDFIRYDADGNPVAGGLTAFEQPEEGTLLEKVAMATHARRTHPSSTPEGEPASFVLNGLPPVHGAPYANPSVDDNGDQGSEVRRYKAAVIQKDVVINRKGWHFPQSRIVTLWEDVAPTVADERPPQPFFFRSNSGESIELWHTNLVPNYYLLDDFQVRTPTDILGQHIHLVKFDVTASDGAANGFNYEDGTLSPDEVRQRIDAINLYGGLFGFDETSQFLDPAEQRPLTAKPAPAIFGSPPPLQNWTGAQTTIQRWDADPLLNNEGVDRTMRTVFTHDHFGPSTHQATGLYGALLIEPSGSSWFDPITGDRLYDPAKRQDGGPTSWQANIVTADPADSYRELAMAVQDSQLAYTRTSRAAPGTISAALFSVEDAFSTELDAGRLSDRLREEFSRAGIVLTHAATVMVDTSGEAWTIADRGDRYEIRRELLFELCATGESACQTLVSLLDAATIDLEVLTAFFNRSGINLNFLTTPTAEVIDAGRVWNIALTLNWLAQEPTPKKRNYRVELVNGVLQLHALKVRIPTMSPSWSDYAYALNPLFNSNNLTSGPPYANLVNFFPSPGGGSVSYRNEPVPLRVANPEGKTGLTPEEERATDLAYAFTSMPRLDADFNRQPLPLEPIDPARPDGFRFPRDPLVPDGPSGAQPTDPFTPLLRAYENDNVQIRLIGGANHDPQYFNVHGLKWFFEPSFTNSGYKNYQTFGVSEHFEMLFTLPPTTTTEARPFTDYLYLGNSNQVGLTSGVWGLLRSYDGEHGLLDDLKPLPNNPQGHAAWDWSAVEPSPGATVRHYHVVATTAAQALPEGALTYNSRGQTEATDPPTVVPDLAIENPYAVLYFLAEDLDENGRLKDSARRPEPLILRAAAGEWVRVTLRNAIDPDVTLLGATAFTPLGQNPPGTPYSTAETQANLDTSRVAGLHPQLLSYDMARSNGFNVGFNPIQTAMPEAVDPEQGTVTYTWYAGNLEVDAATGQVREVPVELGVTNLAPADPMLQMRIGMLGALIVEPEGATWTEDENSRASAMVKKADGSRFREFVAVTQDHVMLFAKEPVLSLDAAVFEPQLNQGLATAELRRAFENVNIDLTFTSGDGLQITVQKPGIFWRIKDQARFFGLFKNGDQIDVHDMWVEAVNYGVEPLPYRFPPQKGGFDPDNTDLTASVSNALVGGDPQTPLFVASAGMPVRFRLAHNGDVDPIRPNGEVIVIDGHSWQEEPYRQDSTVLGFNPLLQQEAGHGQHGAHDRFDVLINSAGGAFEVPGDYLYRTYPSDEYIGGVWGIFRVIEPGRDKAVIHRASWDAAAKTLAAHGSLSVHPESGRIARTLKVFCVSANDKAEHIGDAKIDWKTGRFSFEKRLNLPAGARLRVESPQGGQAESAIERSDS